MEDCDKYNQAFPDGCKALTYNANLTNAAILSGGKGNRFMKNVQDVADTGVPEELSPFLVANAALV